MVDFRTDEDQQLIRDTVAAFAARADPAGRPRRRRERRPFPRASSQQAWELGLVQSAIPEEYGGAGDTPRRSPARSSPRSWPGATCRSRCTCCRRVWWSTRCSSSARRSRRARSCRLRRRPSSAPAPRRWSSRASTSTSARWRPRRDATTAAYVLNGVKCFVPLAADAEHVLVYAASDGRAGSTRSARSSCRRDTPGMRVGEREKNMGLKALATYELTLDELPRPGRQPARRRRRMQLAGCSTARASRWPRWRSAWRARRASTTRATTPRSATPSASPSRRSRRSPSCSPTWRIEIDATRLLIWEAAWKLDRGEDATREALPGEALRRRHGPEGHRQRRPGARRPRLHPRPPGRAVPAQRPRLRHLRRPGDRLKADHADRGVRP